MKTPTVADVILQSKMQLPQAHEPAPTVAEQLLSQPFVPPEPIVEQQSTAYIPADLDLSDLKAPDQDGASALLSSKMKLPQFSRPQTVGEQIMSMKMDVPVMAPEQPPRSFIPADVDLSVKPVVSEPTVADQILKSTFTLPVMVKPESVADRILSTKMTLPGASFSQAVASTAVDLEKRRDTHLECGR